MTPEEFQAVPIGQLECSQASKQCMPSTMATRMLHRGEDIVLFCDLHAPDNMKERAHPIDNRFPGLRPANLLDTVKNLRGRGFAQLRSRLSSQFGIRLQSTGDAANAEQSHVIMQTFGASPDDPCLVTFDQIILEPFTGPGQFDLIERDARRRVFDGTSAGGTPVLGSETMDWQPGDAGKLIRVGVNPGRISPIVSVEDEEHITLPYNITLPSINLVLTMDGENEVTFATSAGITNAITNSEGWSHFVKVITTDKVYRVDFVPGTAGDGIYSIQVRRLINYGR